MRFWSDGKITNEQYEEYMAVVLGATFGALAGGVTGFGLGEGMWQCIELRCGQICHTYNAAMDGLQRQFAALIEKDPAVPVAQRPWVPVRRENPYDWSDEGQLVLKQCPHQEPCPATAECTTLRNQITDCWSDVNASFHFFSIPNHAIRWMVISGVLGVVAGIVSTLAIGVLTASTPALAGLALSAGIAGGIFGTMGAACATLNRVGGCG